MGREESKQQAKEAAKIKEEANAAKNRERKEKVWAQGAKDNSKADNAAAKDAEKARMKAAAAKQLADEGGVVEEPKKAI